MAKLTPEIMFALVDVILSEAKDRLNESEASVYEQQVLRCALRMTDTSEGLVDVAEPVSLRHNIPSLRSEGIASGRVGHPERSEGSHQDAPPC
jgi:hypothetical protein